MRYLRYLFEKGTFEVTVILTSPVTELVELYTWHSGWGLTIANDLDSLTQLTSFAFDLDAVVEEFFEIRTVKDLVSSGF